MSPKITDFKLDLAASFVALLLLGVLGSIGVRLTNISIGNQYQRMSRIK
jgi:hypothetical protein